MQLIQSACERRRADLRLTLVAAKPIGFATSESVDDYPKAILELGGAEDSRVTTKTLAERLGVRTPSVTGMLQKLAGQRPAMVLYEKHRGVRLTSAGKRRAWELVRHHRLLELFLHDVLRYSWDEVHEEAERLEHTSFRNGLRIAWRRSWAIRRSIRMGTGSPRNMQRVCSGMKCNSGNCRSERPLP